LVEVICDTSFLIHLATNRIKNLSSLEVEIGRVQFVVPDTVITELTKLSELDDKKTVALATLDFIKSYKIIELGGSFADDIVVSHVKKHGGIVATMDRELKAAIKKEGGSVISVANNKIILESSKV
jgi:rRNA-processing protein FCF1